MLPVVLIAMFMAGFDIWAVNVAAPSLQRDLHVSDAALQLIVGGYAFMYATGMVTGGRLGDLFGYRRLFLIGVVTFAVASLACGLAPSSGALVAVPARAGADRRGNGPAGGRPDHGDLPGARSGAARCGWYGATMGLGFVSGQILGGGLIQANIFGLGWRAIFLVNVPVGVLAVIVAAVVVPRARGPAPAPARPARRGRRVGRPRPRAGAADARPRRGLARLDVGLAGRGAAGARGDRRLGAAADPPGRRARCSTWRCSATGRSPRAWC